MLLIEVVIGLLRGLRFLRGITLKSKPVMRLKSEQNLMKDE
jgi:hypothetical protein